MKPFKLRTVAVVPRLGFLYHAMGGRAPDRSGKKQKQKLFVFDYDDTLAWNECYYSRAETRLVNYIVEQFFPKCPKVADIVQEFEKRDLTNVKKYGLSTKRFPTSWIETYEHFCKKYGRTSSEWEKDEVENLARTAFHVRPGLVDGAEEVLDYMTEQGDRLVLLTKGDQKLQNKKLRMNRLERWFAESDTYIANIDKSGVFREIMENAEREFGNDGFAAYSVGNSYKSDIQPAIAAGMKGVYVPFDTWYFERDNGSNENAQKQNDLDSGRMQELDTIRELKDNYSKL